VDVLTVLADAFGRIPEVIAEAVDGLEPDDLAFRPDGGSNSIAWLVWHLTRIQDDHVAGAAGSEQVWTAQGWSARFDLPLDEADHGYGHSAHQVGLVRAPADLLTGYYDAVHARTLEYLRTLRAEDLDRVVDRRWDPPVTLGVRLVSVIADDLQHAGQAAYLRGLIERAR
jgi:Protein of unknown function (DUF664)